MTVPNFLAVPPAAAETFHLHTELSDRQTQFEINKVKAMLLINYGRDSFWDQ